VTPGKDEMAKSKNNESKIDGGVRDFTEVAKEIERTSSDGRFSRYEYAPKKDPRDGDLILQQRGEPDKSTPPGDES
jgi:hypothetical protein